MVKLIIDENVDNRITQSLKKNKYDVISILDGKRGLKDKEILKLCVSNKALLITEDCDFGEWIFSFKEESVGVIFLRYVSKDLNKISKSIIKTLKKYDSELYHKFAVISPRKIRIREI